MEKKTTKREYFEVLKSIVLESGSEKEGELISFIDNEVSLLNKKAESAAKRAAQKRAEGDELREAVCAVLTEDFQTIEEITAATDYDPEVATKARVTARLNQLFKAGEARKELISVEGKKGKVTAYALPEAVEVAE